MFPYIICARVHSDWHVTFATLAGIDPKKGEPNAKSPMDG